MNGERETERKAGRQRERLVGMMVRGTKDCERKRGRERTKTQKKDNKMTVWGESGI